MFNEMSQSFIFVGTSISVAYFSTYTLFDLCSVIFVLTLYFQGITVTADLLPNGKIRSTDSGEIFSTPSSWAVSCKKNINPTKSSGCGWSAVSFVINW